MGFNKSAHAIGKNPGPISMSSTNRQGYKTVSYMQRSMFNPKQTFHMLYTLMNALIFPDEENIVSKLFVIYQTVCNESHIHI